MSTPVLFLIYNRPEYSNKVFESIKKYKPKKLFIHADGPNRDKLDDVRLCTEARQVINYIDWECELETLFRDVNLGCKLGMVGGINWFFENVEEGIILEDDCLPTRSFFRYCEILLEKYRGDEKIMMISGSNPATSVNVDSDYFFSRFYHIWGWATWKRAWGKFDVEIADWPKYKKTEFLKNKFPNNPDNILFLEKMFDQIHGKKSSVWGVQWTYSCLINDGLAILPKHNLVSNVGFVGTHQMNTKQLALKTREINFSTFTHPIVPNINETIEGHLFEQSGLKALINN